MPSASRNAALSLPHRARMSPPRPSAVPIGTYAKPRPPSPSARRRRTSARTTSFVASSTATAPGTPAKFASSLSFASRYASKLRCQCRWSGVMFSSTATLGAKRTVDASW